MNNIKISIITPSFNQGRFIEDTIKSVLNQTYKNIEYILVDGGSTDDTMAIVNKYADQIDVIIHEKDSGQSDAINKGFKLATGTLIGWINSDDVLYPTCVEEIVKLYTLNNDGSIYHCSVIDVIDVNNKFLRNYSVNIPNRTYLLEQNYDVCQPGSFYLNRSLVKVNNLDESLYYCMDLDLWIKLLDHGEIYAIREKALAAIREGEYTKTTTGRFFFMKEIRKTLSNNGVRFYRRTIIKTYWIQFKEEIKHLLKK